MHEVETQTWEVQTLQVQAGFSRADLVEAREHSAAITLRAETDVVQQMQNVIGTLYLGKRYVAEETTKAEYVTFHREAYTLPVAETGTISGHEHPAAIGLGVAFLAALVFPALSLGWAGVPLWLAGLTYVVGSWFLTASVTVCTEVTVPAHYDEKEVPVQIVHVWQVDPTLEGNKDYKGLPLRGTYQRVVFRDGHEVFDPLAKYDAHMEAQ